MRARVSIPLALALLLSVPAAGAETARFVPGLVLDATVPAYVTGLPAGSEVTLAIGDASATKGTATAGSVLVKLAGVEPGLREWTLSVSGGNVTTTTHGFVLVDTELAELRASVALQQGVDAGAVANLTKSLHAFEAHLEARQNRTLGNLTAKLDALPLLALRNATATLANLPKPAAPVVVAPASTAPAPGWMAAVPTGLLALLLIPIHFLALLQARKGRREALMLLLVLAAKAGITPDSPEFQKAMEAFEGKRPKVKKAKAPAAANA
jgi:hypothetical protein